MSSPVLTIEPADATAGLMAVNGVARLDPSARIVAGFPSPAGSATSTSNWVCVMPSGSNSIVRIASSTGRPVTSSITRPTTARPKFEYSTRDPAGRTYAGRRRSNSRAGSRAGTGSSAPMPKKRSSKPAVCAVMKMLSSAP